MTEQRQQDRRSGIDRRSDARGDRRRGDRRVAWAIGAALCAGVPEAANADVFTRRNAKGVFEATNHAAEGFKLTYRSKGVVTHSPGFKPGAPAPRELEPLILEAAARERLDPALVRAVIRVESAFDQRAVSSAGARGLMQLMPDTAARFGVTDAFDARQNIAGGARYLAVLLRMFRGDVPLAVAAYNAGEGAVTRHKGIPPYRETRDYVRKVSALLGPAMAPSAVATGMMSFTPGSEARISEPIRRSDTATSARREILYRWSDARGVTHVGSTPPAGVEYSAVRSSD